ncbi:LacI family DNA-binding transcriptional regulator [Pirellulimonas nuda]|uniref:LacI family DNA-binding transcriptional regulator n=1 Tax=Pirellulimonas nuda TaxID=2528009 RepID=UPI0018D44B47|nr:GntR family transcriptional regulator [Pirellulimonas nuda]
MFRLLEKGIRSGQYGLGSQLPTEAILVEQLGYSRPTIARAMRDLQDLGLIERRPGAGSFVRRGSAKKNAAATLGLLVPELGCGDIFDPICAQIARRVQREQIGLMWGDAGASQLHATGGVGRLDAHPEAAVHAAERLIVQAVSGVFFVPLSGPGLDAQTNQHILKLFASAGVSVVLLDRDIEGFPARSEFDLVSVDHLQGQYRLTEHIVAAGHRRIVYLQWPGHTDSLLKRVSGMRACLAASGCEGLVIKGDAADTRFIGDLIDAHSPDVIMCENDMVATRLMQTLAGLDVKVPADLSVAGFNDISLAQHLSVPLTTVRQPCQDLGDAAVEAMRLRIEEPRRPPRTMLLDAQLAVRESVAQR